MSTPRTILISTPTWLEFCRHYPEAAQWLVLHLDLPVYHVAALTPNLEPVVFVVPGVLDEQQLASAHENQSLSSRESVA